MEDQLGPDFRHLKRVVKKGIDRGDLGPAQLYFKAYSDEAKRQHSSILRDISKEKARLLAAIIASAPTNPAELIARMPAGVDPFPIWQVGKKQRDPLTYMRLNWHQRDAANEITAIWEAMTRELQIRSKPLDSPRVDVSRKTIIDPLDAIERFVGPRLHRYGQWADKQSTGIVPGLTRLGFVLKVLIERMGIREIEDVYKVEHGRLGRMFRQILNEY